MSPTLVPLLTAERSNGFDLDELSESVVNGVVFEENGFITEKSRDGFNKRMRDIVVDMVRLGYI